MYELFEHTADLGLRVRAPDLEALFRDAARGLVAIIAEPEPRSPSSRRYAFDLPAAPPELLLFDWLSELLYVVDTEHVVLGPFDVRLDARGLTAETTGHAPSDGGFRWLREVKAITYHGLKVVREGEGWLAEVVVDI